MNYLLKYAGGIIPEERAAARRLLAGSLALPPEPSQRHFYFPRRRSFTFSRCTALLLVCGCKRPSVTWYGKKTREPRGSFFTCNVEHLKARNLSAYNPAERHL